MNVVHVKRRIPDRLATGRNRVGGEGDDTVRRLQQLVVYDAERVPVPWARFKRADGHADALPRLANVHVCSAFTAERPKPLVPLKGG